MLFAFSSRMIIVFLFFGILASPSIGLAQDIETNFPKSLEETAREGNFIDPTNDEISDKKIEEVIGGSIGFLLSFTSLVFFFWLFYGAYQWLLARGNEEKITKAQKTIREAVWAILIIALSYLIVKLILELLTLGESSLQIYG